MIQGGDPTGTGMGDPGYSFNDEVDPDPELRYAGPAGDGKLRAKYQRQPVLHYRAGHPSLNQQYTLFGQCDDASVDVVKTIARVQTTPRTSR